MSKAYHKLNAKFVGVDAHGDPHFGGITKKENGITLIALIITIIVMLILTGVTLSITLGENGLINKANDAKIQMQIETDREELISAVVGAIGIDGKVNFTYLDSHLPEGFTGSNGTYISANGHTFTVSENGEVVYTGAGTPGDDIIDNGGESAISLLNGRYYFDNEFIGFIEVNNGVGIFGMHMEDGSVIYDDSGSSTAYLSNIDEIAKTGTWTWREIYYPSDSSSSSDSSATTEEVYEEIATFKYDIIEENNKVVNKLIILDYGDENYEYLFQNFEGLITDIEGTYQNDEATSRFVFTNDGLVERQEFYNGEWKRSSYYMSDPHFYFYYNEQYYLNGYWKYEGIFTISSDKTTITLADGNTYTKINPDEEEKPEEPSVDYTLLGSGDTITGYSPTSYTSSNPYTVSLAGCSGTFNTENLTWKVILVSGNTITMKASGVTTGQLSLTGANGWNNSLTALNNVCSEVYGGSTSKYTSTARSVAFSDVGVSATPSSGSYAASSYGSNNKFPTSYLTEYQGLTDVTEDVAGEGYVTNSDITVTNTSFVVGSSNSSSIEFVGTPYWVDKRCVVATSSTSASFSVGWVNSSATATGEATLFDSSGTSITQTKSLRPVVTLTINDWTCLDTTDGGTNWTITNE